MEIWCDSDVEARWFMQLDERLADAATRAIGTRGSNSPVVDSLVAYDRPDIILLDEGTPMLVLEKTSEVPTGHNVGQRLARLVRAAEHGISTFFFLPFESRKHGAYSSVCRINARLLTAMRRMTEIHHVPVLPVEWPADDHGTLITDGSEDTALADLVSAALDSWPALWPNAISKHRSWLATEEQRRIEQFPSYAKLPPSVAIRDTSEFFNEVEFTPLADSPLEARAESLVYRIGMTPENCRRQDPYTGTQFIYDYAWLREGPTPADRTKNLILHIPHVDLRTWQELNPNDPSSKSCNWYLTADAIVLSDGVISLPRSSGDG